MPCHRCGYSKLVPVVGLEPTRLSVARLTPQLPAKELECSRGTYLRYKGVVDTFMDFLGSQRRSSLQSLSVGDIQAFRDQQSKRLSTGSVNVSLKVLRVALGKAVKSEFIDKNPAEMVDTVADRDKKTRRAFTVEELRKLLDAADQEWQTMILAGLYTGLRLKDLADLTWSNIDLVQSELTVMPQKTRGTTGKTQIIPIAKPLLRHLESIPTDDDPKAPISPTLYQRSSTWLSGQFYELMSQCGLVEARQSHRKAEKSGRKAKRQTNELSFHCLRHTATSLLKNAGVSEAVAMDLIGHQSAAVSRNYTHIDQSTKRKAIDQMPDISQ